MLKLILQCTIIAWEGVLLLGALSLPFILILVLLYHL